MAQINLLKQKNPIGTSVNILLLYLVRVLFLIAFGVLVFYAWTHLRVMSVNKEMPKIQKRIADSKKEALSLGERQEFLIRQAQLQEYENLLSDHRLLSRLLPEIARLTLKSGNYNNITLSEEGILSFSINLPNLYEVDKFLQVFDFPQFNESFSEVRVGGISKTQKDEQNVYTVSFRMKYNPKIVKNTP